MKTFNRIVLPLQFMVFLHFSIFAWVLHRYLDCALNFAMSTALLYFMLASWQPKTPPQQSHDGANPMTDR